MPIDHELQAKIETLRDLRAERSLELQLLAAREQYFWVPWTTCLGAALLGLDAGNPLIRIGIPLVTGMIAEKISRAREPGINDTLAILKIRHEAVLRITKEDERLKDRGFSRVVTETRDDGTRTFRDEAWPTFNYSLIIIEWTPRIWRFLVILAVISVIWDFGWSIKHLPAWLTPK